jgi:hypothetical protein
MRTASVFFLAALVAVCVPIAAQESKQQADAGARQLTDRSQRGTLHDTSQYVRGDSGKWQDEPVLIHAPPIGQKPAKLSLDDWLDQLLEGNVQLTGDDDNWLLLRTRQLDDNDRVWVERIERQGNQISIVIQEAVWQGKYSKNFTGYQVFGVNLGKLAPGKYQVRCLVKPLAFKQFEGTGRPQENWPKDEQPANKKSLELRTAFTVSSNEPQELGGLESADRRWAVTDARATPSFAKHVVPLFNKVGLQQPLLPRLVSRSRGLPPEPLRLRPGFGP